MERFSKKGARFIVTTAVAIIGIGSLMIGIFMQPSAGGIYSAMFYSEGIVTSVSQEAGTLSLIINEQGIFNEGESVTFDYSNHREALDELRMGDRVTVHHWLDKSKKGYLSKELERCEEATATNSQASES